MLDYTAQQCSGIASWFRDRTTSRRASCFGGMPARSGVTSALLVHAGWNGVDDVLSGRDNFLLANAPDGQAASCWSRSSASATKSSARTSSAGPWARPIQAPLDAMEALLKRQPIDPDQVQADPRAVGARVGRRQQRPAGHQHPVRDGADADRQDRDVPIDPRQAADAGSGDSPAAGEGAARSARRQGGGGAGARPPLLEITLADGTRLTQDTGPVLGTADNPMTREQLVAKCRDLMAPVLGAAQTTRLIDRVLALEKAKDIRELRPLLQRTYRAGSAEAVELPRTLRVGCKTLHC